MAIESLGSLRASVIGTPISHSLSPAIFGFLGERLGVSCEYRKDEVFPAELERYLSALREAPSRIGCNVTLPHKQAVLKHVDSMSVEVGIVGAANVVKRTSGRLSAYNTDAGGMAAVFNKRGVTAAGRDVVVLGTGGAARAMIYAAASAGAARVRVVGRESGLAAGLVSQMGRGLESIGSTQYTSHVYDRAVPSADIYIQATSTGMRGGPAPELSLLPENAAPGAVAIDLVYRPRETPFLKQARERGLRVLDGLELLVAQALLTWEIWTGDERARGKFDELRDYLLKMGGD